MKNLHLLATLLIFNFCFNQVPEDYFNFQEQLFQKECESNNCAYKYITGFSPGEPSKSIMKWNHIQDTDFTLGTRKISGQYQYKYMLETWAQEELYAVPPVLLAGDEGDFRLTFDVNVNSKVKRYGVMIGFKDFENFCALEIIPAVKQAYIRTSIQGINLDQGPFFINDDTKNGNINIVASGSNIIFAYNGNPIKMIPKNLTGNKIVINMFGNSAKIFIDNFKLTKQQLK